MKTKLERKQKKDRGQVKLATGLLSFTLVTLSIAGGFLSNPAGQAVFHDDLTGSGSYNDLYVQTTVSAQDQSLLETLENLDYAAMSASEFRKHFCDQVEKSDTFYTAASELGYNAVYGSKEQNPFHTALFFTAAEVYAEHADDQNIFLASYFADFGDFDGGEDGAVSVSVGYTMEILLSDPSAITVAQRDRAILSLRQNISETLNTYRKEDWTSMNPNQQLKEICAEAADSHSSKEMSFVLQSVDADVFQL